MTSKARRRSRRFWTARARCHCCSDAEPLGSQASTRPNAVGGSPGVLCLESYHVSASYLLFTKNQAAGYNCLTYSSWPQSHLRLHICRLRSARSCV
jgi:hypothetical protein